MAFTSTPTSEQSVLQRAMHHANVAVEADRQREYVRALDEYVRALEHFDVFLRHERGERMRARVRAKVSDYLARAEVLKQHLAEHPEAATPKSRDDATSDASSDASTIGRCERPSTLWDDVIGADAAKQALFEATIFPTKFPSLFAGGGDKEGGGGAVVPWRGILLYGPPGTGKTLLASAAAAATSSSFFSVSAADIMGKYVGESERHVRELFEQAAAAAPALIFVDEVDSMLVARSDEQSESSARVKTEFFVQMDGMRQRRGVVVVAATNRPWALDDAARRRFERRVHVELPDEPSRRRLFERRLASYDHRLESADFTRLAAASVGRSCADVDVAVRRAAMSLMSEAARAEYFVESDDGRFVAATDSDGARAMTIRDVPPDALALRRLEAADVEHALASTPSSVSADVVERCRAFASE